MGRVGPVRHSLDSLARMALWPTATAGDAKASGGRNLTGSSAHMGVSLTDAALFGNSTTRRDRATPKDGESGRVLNPQFVEMLMGYPPGWSDCAASATESFRTWLRSRGGSSSIEWAV